MAGLVPIFFSDKTSGLISFRQAQPNEIEREDHHVLTDITRMSSCRESGLARRMGCRKESKGSREIQVRTISVELSSPKCRRVP